MTNLLHSTKKHVNHVVQHFHVHHKKYVGGLFASFAVVKTFGLIAGFFGISILGSTFAAGDELNSTNITQAPYNCAVDASLCDLGHQNIGSIAPGTFVNHSNLIQINLIGNQITSIESDDFDGLSNLLSLDLSQNQISSIEEGGFSSLSSLTYLDLTYNKLTTLPESIMNLSGSSLYIEYNNICASLFSPDLLNFLNNLVGENWQEQQDRSSCPVSCSTVTDVSVEECEGLVALYSMNTDGRWNHPKNRPTADTTTTTVCDWDGLVCSNGHPVAINVSNYSLSGEVPKEINKLTSLMDLHLFQNQISSIEEGTFSGLYNLQTLNLFDNELTTLPESIMNGTTTLTSFSIYNNNICTSSLSNDLINFITNLVGSDWQQDISSCPVSCSTITDVSVEACEGLVALYSMNTDGRWNHITHRLTNDTSTTTVCDWDGLNCDDGHRGHPRAINLSNYSLSGVIPTAAGKLSDLKYLKLPHNQISGIASGVFAGMNLFHIDLSDNQITSLDDGFFSEVAGADEIYLNKNKLTTLPTSIVTGDHNFLDLFDIHDNAICTSSLSIDVLNFVNDLMGSSWKDSQDISSCPISCSTVTDVSVKECEGLVALYSMTTDEQLWNHTTHRLTNDTSTTTVCDWDGLNCDNGYPISINLWERNLSGIISQEISKLSSLEYLGLGKNQISSIEEGAFAGLFLLDNLDLSYNQISSIESGGFAGLSSLSYLDLYKNQITSIEDGDFAGLSSLTYLNLNENQLSSIESGGFAGLSILDNLQLFQNQIASIESGDFAGLSSLTYLNLNENQLSSIETGAFDELMQLYSLNLSTTCTLTPITIDYPGGQPSTDDGGCSIIATDVSNDFVSSLQNRSYGENNGYYEGTYTISFVPGATTTFLADVRMLSANKNNYTQAYYQSPVEVEYLSGTVITRNTNPYTGNITAPFLFAPHAAQNLSEVLAVTRFGALTDSISFSQDVTVKIPVIHAHTGDIVSIYSSPDGSSWTFHTGTNVVEYNGILYAIFTTNHATWYAVSNNPIVHGCTNASATNYNSGATIDDNSCLYNIPGCTNTNATNYNSGATIDDGSCNFPTPVVPATPTGGNGGGTILHPDTCSPQRDCSSSYYDNLCGPCTSTGTTHGSDSCDVINSPYSPELTAAFTYAYDLGITTQCPIAKANLTDKVIRSHFAKMVTEFAIKVLKKQPNTKLACTFADVGNESSELNFYMKTACQLGLMGRESDGKATQKKFNPKDTMTRAQLGTVLSRLLYGNVNNSTDSANWYAKHLQALNKNGIMNDISKPKMEEIRGFILLMFQRAANKK